MMFHNININITILIIGVIKANIGPRQDQEL